MATKDTRREALIEAQAVKEAQRNGWYVRKFKSTVRGVPDRMFAKGSRVVFIEFKQRTGELGKLQEREIVKMRAAGLEVYVCRSVEAVRAELLLPTAFLM